MTFKRRGRGSQVMGQDTYRKRAIRNLVLVTTGVITFVVAGTALYVRWKLG